MSLNTVCRVCLATDVPMHIIAGSPLQNVYEKLTSISLTTAHRPVAACYMCHAQLRKCRDLMVRSLKAEEVLTQLVLGGEAVDIELISMKTRELKKSYELTLTPHKLLVIVPEHRPVNINIKEEPLSAQCKEEIYAEGDLTFEESGDKLDVIGVVRRDEESIENDGTMHREEISEQIGNAVYAERDILTDTVAIKPEIPEETGTYVRRCIGYLKFEDLDDETDNERNEMTSERSTEHQEQLSSPRKELMKTVQRRCIDYLKFEVSEFEEDRERVIQTEIDIKDEASTDGRDVGVEELEEAVEDESIEAIDAARDEKCKQTHVEKIQDGSTLTPGGKNLKKRSIHRKLVKEATGRNTGRSVLGNTKPTNNRHISINHCVSTNKDVGTTSSDYMKRMFICDDCGYVFDDKYLLIEHIGQHAIVKKTSSPQHTTLHEQKVCHIAVVNNYTETRSVKNLLECELCQQRFTEKELLIEHLNTHPVQRPFECEICKVRFGRKHHLNAHLIVHTKEKPYECEICELKFRWKANLNKHLKVHTKEKPYECEICDVRFGRREHLKAHLIVHTKEKPYECEICELRFGRKHYLKAHLIVHTKEKPYECEICELRFGRKDHLKAHLIVHTKEKPYECEVCELRFGRKTNLNKHLKVHTKEKPYEFEICEVRCARKHDLKKHLTVHTKEKPYECEICKVRFGQKYDLKKHLRVHTKEKPYECEICDVRFGRREHLKAHLIVHTKEKPYECEICELRFGRKDHLKAHLIVHTKEKPYECEVCEVRCARKRDLKKHLTVHTKEKPYECEICKVRFGRKYDLKKHLTVHTKEKPYECEICVVRFGRKSDLNRHLKIHTEEKP